jgi:YVTN family beta-propeller protein
MVVSRRHFVLGGLGAAGCSQKERGFSGLAFIANQDGRAVAVVNLAALALVRHIHLDAHPTQVLTRQALPAVYAVTPGAEAVCEFDPQTLTAKRTAGLGSAPIYGRFDPDGAALWLLCGQGRQLIRVPVSRFQRDHTVALPAPAADFDFGPPNTPAAGLCAVSFPSTGEFGLVRLASGRIEHLARLGSATGRVRFRKDGRLLFVADSGTGRLTAFDVPRRRVAVHLPLGIRPEQMCFRVDGGQLFLTGQGMDAVVAVHTYQTEVGATLLAGHNPGYLAVSAGVPDYLFVANPASGNVTIVNLQSRRVMAVATVGREPCHIAVTPNNEYALVLNRESGDMAVLHAGSLTVRRTRSVPILTMVPVGSQPVSAVVRAV